LRSHEKKLSKVFSLLTEITRLPTVMNLYILSISILLFCTANAGKGNLTIPIKQSKRNNQQPRTINTVTHDAGEALPVAAVVEALPANDAVDLPVARAIIDTTFSRAVKKYPMSATSQYTVKSMITLFNTIRSDDEYRTRRIQGCYIESDLVDRIDVRRRHRI
jgi:hypothetical protein